MPVDHRQAREVADTIAELYRSAELRLTRLITRQLGDGVSDPQGWAARKLTEAQAVRRAAQLVADALYRDATPAIRTAVADGYRAGNATAVTDLAEQLAGDVGPAARDSDIQRRAGNAIQALADAAVNELAPVHRAVVPQTVAVYRKVIARAAARKLTATAELRQAIQSAWQALSDEGVVRFVDATGRRWSLSSYAEMVVRTAVARATLRGQTDQWAATGVTQCSVIDKPRECERCRPYHGRVLQLAGPPVPPAITTLDDAMRRGLFHPNCRCATVPYLPGRSRPRMSPSPEGQEGYDAEQEQRRLERGLRHWRTRYASAITAPAQQQAAAKIQAWSARLEDHLEQWPRLRRKSPREYVGAGFIPNNRSDPA